MGDFLEDWLRAKAGTVKASYGSPRASPPVTSFWRELAIFTSGPQHLQGLHGSGGLGLSRRSTSTRHPRCAQGRRRWGLQPGTWPPTGHSPPVPGLDSRRGRNRGGAPPPAGGGAAPGALQPCSHHRDAEGRLPRTALAGPRPGLGLSSRSAPLQPCPYWADGRSQSRRPTRGRRQVMLAQMAVTSCADIAAGRGAAGTR